MLHALDGVRVVEIATGTAGGYAGRLLMECGADVTVVRDRDESVGHPGQPSEASHLYVTVGKRAVGWTTDQGDELGTLVAGADVVIHELLPDAAAALGIDGPSLGQRAPRAVVLGITPFGATGPAVRRATYPLIDLHAGGEGWELVQEVADDEHRTPLRAPAMTGGDATELYCGLMGAIGVAVALRRARRTGAGNHIDMSKQEASMWPARVELSGFPNAGIVERRRTRERMPGGVLRTRDGWVEIMPFEERMWQALVDAMGRPAWTEEERFVDRLQRLALAAEINPRLEEWTRPQSARQVTEALQARGCPAYEVLTVDALARSAHYAARSYFADVPLPGVAGDGGGATVRLPTTPFTGPKASYTVRAPALAAEPSAGEPSAVQSLSGRGGDTIAERLLLSGVRVLDLTFNRAGPSCTAMMAAMGAEVIRVESSARIDPNRMTRTVSGKVVYAAEEVDLERRWSFGSINMGKQSIQLNLQAPGTKAVLRRLVEVSDVVVESFTPGTIERYGFGYDVLRQWRSDVILVSVNGFGRGGPDEGYRAYADIFGAAGGLMDLTGYPDRPPMQFVGRLDSVVGSFAAFGALAALVERDRTGDGQHVDVSAAEAVTCLLGAPMVEYLEDGRIRTRTGNRVDDMAPHNCYRCRDADDWVAIAVATDAEWRALCRAIERPELADDPAYAALAARKANEDEVDKLVESWTRERSSEEAAELLQRSNVAAVPSMRPDQLYHDPHLTARGAWVEYEHPVQGIRHDLRLPWQFSNGECRYGPAPLFGQHNEQVYGGLLGMSAEEITSLKAASVIH